MSKVTLNGVPFQYTKPFQLKCYQKRCKKDAEDKEKCSEKLTKVGVCSSQAGCSNLLLRFKYTCQLRGGKVVLYSLKQEKKPWYLIMNFIICFIQEKKVLKLKQRPLTFDLVSWINLVRSESMRQSIHKVPMPHQKSKSKSFPRKSCLVVHWLWHQHLLRFQLLTLQPIVSKKSYQRTESATKSRCQMCIGLICWVIITN